MEILDLIEAAEKSEDCSKSAAEIFSKKYAEKQIAVEREPTDEFGAYARQLYNGTVIWISNLQAATKMINHFGHLIRTLRINDRFLSEPFPKDEVSTIFSAINAHCCESLVEFEIHYDGHGVNNVFNHITCPFQRVENLTLVLRDMNDLPEDRQLQLNTVFPNLRQLDTGLNRYTDPLVNCEFSKLKKLSIYAGLSANELNASYKSNEPTLIDLFRKNQQITDLYLYFSEFAALRHVKNYLWHLEALDIAIYSDSDKSEEIYFPTVKRLSLRVFADNGCEPPNGILFNVNALQDLSLRCHSKNNTNNDYIDFLLKYPKIQKLSATYSFPNVYLSKLIGKFPELSEVGFNFNVDVSVDNIIAFVKQSPSLNSMQFSHNTIGNFDAFATQLETELGADFDIKLKDSKIPFKKEIMKYFTIERKIPILISP